MSVLTKYLMDTYNLDREEAEALAPQVESGELPGARHIQQGAMERVAAYEQERMRRMKYWSELMAADAQGLELTPEEQAYLAKQRELTAARMKTHAQEAIQKSIKARDAGNEAIVGLENVGEIADSLSSGKQAPVLSRNAQRLVTPKPAVIKAPASVVARPAIIRADVPYEQAEPESEPVPEPVSPINQRLRQGPSTFEQLVHQVAPQYMDEKGFRTAPTEVGPSTMQDAISAVNQGGETARVAASNELSRQQVIEFLAAEKARNEARAAGAPLAKVTP